MFIACVVVSAIALIFGFFLPAGRPVEEDDGEKFVMAEMTAIDADHEPVTNDER